MWLTAQVKRYSDRAEFFFDSKYKNGFTPLSLNWIFRQVTQDIIN